jgi:hypothetical protein
MKPTTISKPNPAKAENKKYNQPHDKRSIKFSLLSVTSKRQLLEVFSNHLVLPQAAPKAQMAADKENEQLNLTFRKRTSLSKATQAKKTPPIIQ